MNKARIIWGIVCFALAGLFGLLSINLPEEELVFMVNNTNMFYLVPLALIIAGIVLLATAKDKNQKTEKENTTVAVDNEKVVLNKRLETIGWGFFLVMLGGFLFVPHMILDKGFWSIGVGVILLGLNIARFFYRIKMSGFTTFLGIVSLISGIAQVIWMQSINGSAFLIILGIYLVFKAWFDRQKLFGKAEES